MQGKTRVELVGVLNVTPDSFSDGGKAFDSDSAIKFGKELGAIGATIVEVGGDSTRPGSKCVGTAEEWRRISAVVTELSKTLQVSVDTHHAETACLALDSGANIINDISAGGSKELLQHVARAGAKLVLMHAISAPHQFGHLEEVKAEAPEIILQRIRKHLLERAELACNLGVKRENIIIDPGMGAFISADPQLSFELLQGVHELADFNLGVMLALSRKGFLKCPGEKSVQERDGLSALMALAVTLRWRSSQTLYIRAHNVSLHKSFIENYAEIA